MHAKRISYLPLPVVLAALGLLVGWACLPANGQAAGVESTALSSQPPFPTPSPGAPDARWLALVRQAGGQTNRALNASFTINLNLTATGLAGTSPGLQPLSARVLRQGIQVASGETVPVPDPGGNFYQVLLTWEDYPCGPELPCTIYSLVPGDQAFVSQAGTEISMTVPALTALAEPQDDRLHGQAPPGVALTAYLFPFADSAAVYTTTGSADPSGGYQIDIAGQPGLHRRDTGYLLVEPQPGRRAYVYWVAPFLRAQVGGAVLSGMSHPNAEVIITASLSSVGGDAILKGYSAQDGFFEIDFADIFASPDRFHWLQPGDRLLAVSSGQAFSMTLPQLSASASQAQSRITGQAPAGAAFEVRSFSGPLIDVELPIWESQPETIIPVTASTGGAYSLTLPLETGDYGGVFLELPDEHQAYARFSIPFVYALMAAVEQPYNGPLLAGQVSASLAPITITIQGPSGYMKDWLVWRSGSAGEFSLYAGNFFQSQLVILPGDALRINSPTGEEISLYMPELTAEASQHLATVSGTAPPSARLTVVAHNVYPPYPMISAAPLGGGDGSPPEATLVVTATQTGEYLADFSSQVTFNDFTYGEVVYTTPQGYRVARAWGMESCPPVPTRVQVGGNWLNLHSGPGCEFSQLRLVDALGYEKYTIDLYYGEGNYELFTPLGEPIAILPGDRILTTVDGGTKESQVPPLTLQIDPHSYQVSGQAPPGARLEIAVQSNLSDGPFPSSQIVTATQAGTFTADLYGSYSYHAGDTLRATLLDNPVEYTALAVLPRLHVELYDWAVSAWLAPLSPYTLILTTPITSGQAAGYARSDGSIYPEILSIPYGGLQVIPGSRLRLESDGFATELDVPNLTALVDLQTARVSGQAPPSAHLRLDFRGHREDLYFSSTEEITASAQGQFTVEFPGSAPLESANGKLTYIDASGHEAFTRFYSPRLAVTLDQGCVEGFGPNPGGVITLILTSSDGSYSQSLTENSNLYDAGFSLCFERQVHAGDQLELSAGGESILAYTAVSLTARHDYGLQAIEGQAPPGSSPEVIFHDALGNAISRRPWLNPDGSFGMDTSDLKLRIGDLGLLILHDAQGNSTSAIIRITGFPIFLPTVYQD